MQNMTTFVYKSDGRYLGFINGDILYSRDGQYLGWLEGEFAWSSNGQFRGILWKEEGHSYIVFKKFSVSPVPRMPRSYPTQISVLLDPPKNIPPISLLVGFEDGF